MNEWIDIKDKLPAHYQQVLVASEYADGNEAIFIEFYNGNNSGFLGVNGKKDKYVTHWMQMPEMPKPITQK